MQIEDKGTVEPSKMYFAMTNEFAKKSTLLCDQLWQILLQYELSN
ncbi:hypothetical protein MKY30_09915 [Oceanobacillus sp. FSL W8-0428]